MKTFALLTAFALFGAGTVARQDPQPAAPQPEHAWLKQLIGEWTAKSEMSMGPGTEPMTAEGTERVRALGELWVVAEGSATMGGQPFSSMLTLGYDPQKKVFVGSWVDTMQTHMWVYRGTLDAEKKTLTLDTEGPSFDDPSKTSKYRDAITVVGKDEKKLTSSLLGPDGKWTTFMTCTYTRKK